MSTRLSVIAGLLFISTAARAEKLSSSPPAGLPSAQEMIDSKTDIWGEAARRQPDGPSYEFFRPLLSPLHWTNSEFRHYPIVLSAPQHKQKIRFISNGSGINLRAYKPPMWNEVGTPVLFGVGNSEEPFGNDLARLDGPHYLDKCLPIIQVNYRQDAVVYHQEAFASTTPDLADAGAVLVRFWVTSDDKSTVARVAAEIRTEGDLHDAKGSVVDDQKNAFLAYDKAWKWGQPWQRVIATLKPEESAYLLVYTNKQSKPPALTADFYDRERKQCIDTWKKILATSIDLQTPEPIVNDAWRSMVVGDFMIASGDRMHYSAMNAYAKLYQGECGDSMRSLLQFGYVDAARGMLKPLLEFTRPDTIYHVCGQKMQMLAYYYWITHDAETLRKYEPTWRPFLERILKNRDPKIGLLPKDNYAGDIHEQFYSLNSNANCWKGLRDMAAVFDELGNKDEASKLRDTAAEYKRAILDAAQKSIRHETVPPFIPIALLANEEAHDPLTATRFGSYYDLICPYIMGSEIFGQGSKEEDWLLGYMENHGGIAMGMVRVRPAEGQFKGLPGLDVLYGIRYQLALLRRDEREKALTGFYGQLAQAMTPETFLGGEGSRLTEMWDGPGRGFYLPPNSTSNALFLTTLRYLLIQDWDLNEDSRPDTLRLLYGMPKRWLKDGAKLSLVHAPTLFGEIALKLESHLNSGEVEVELIPPPRAPEHFQMRLPLPGGAKVTSAKVGDESLPLAEDGAVDLSGKKAAFTVHFLIQSADQHK